MGGDELVDADRVVVQTELLEQGWQAVRRVFHCSAPSKTRGIQEFREQAHVQQVVVIAGFQADVFLPGQQRVDDAPRCPPTLRGGRK
ncbi:hypothetical protein [Pseudomonas sp. IAC-BECa141]|uniref:hypothetical protein n=1 Tax=Pseudomonas sp. IAC-BECa141 TaxID=2793103 RepID=UPI001D07EE2F|nr:hypothetical protein [Pseudomonas sp. IAC-BECa141]UDI95756.1 hypothetical protein I5961_00820 [Pseudomonas sp. IAC-BECa141]